MTPDSLKPLPFPERPLETVRTPGKVVWSAGKYFNVKEGDPAPMLGMLLPDGKKPDASIVLMRPLWVTDEQARNHHFSGGVDENGVPFDIGAKGEGLVQQGKGAPWVTFAYFSGGVAGLMRLSDAKKEKNKTLFYLEQGAHVPSPELIAEYEKIVDVTPHDTATLVSPQEPLRELPQGFAPAALFMRHINKTRVEELLRLIESGSEGKEKARLVIRDAIVRIGKFVHNEKLTVGEYLLWSATQVGKTIGIFHAHDEGHTFIHDNNVNLAAQVCDLGTLEKVSPEERNNVFLRDTIGSPEKPNFGGYTQIKALAKGLRELYANEIPSDAEIYTAFRQGYVSSCKTEDRELLPYTIET